MNKAGGGNLAMHSFYIPIEFDNFFSESIVIEILLGGIEIVLIKFMGLILVKITSNRCRKIYFNCALI